MNPRKIEPLLPPPGRFDQVVREARSRRYHRAAAVTGIAGVFLVGIMGGLALGGLSGLQDGVFSMTGLGPASSSSATPSNDASTRASVVPSTGATTHHKKKPTGQASTTGQVPPQAAVVRARVVDPAGAPVPDVYVYTGRYRDGDFVPHELPVARTGPAGGFSIPCEREVLLTPWPLNHPMSSTGDAHVAATMIGAPVCSRVAKARVMTMDLGATIEGQVRTDIGCAGEDFRMSLWLDGNAATSVRLTGLHEGDAFRLTGVPTGNHLLGSHDKRVDVTVAAAGDTVSQNITFNCPELPTPTGLPSVTPSPAPTPSETDSSSPSSTPSDTASPTGTGS